MAYQIDMDKGWVLALAAVAVGACMISLAAAFGLLAPHGVDGDPHQTPVMALIKEDASDSDELLLHAGPIDQYGVGYDEVRIRVDGPDGASGNWTISLSDFVGTHAIHRDIVPGYDMLIVDVPEGDHHLTVSYGDMYCLSARDGSFAAGDWWMTIIYVWSNGVMAQLGATYPWG